MEPLAKVALSKGRYIPQAFAMVGGALWVAQRNSLLNTCHITKFVGSGDSWEEQGSMAILNSHGWPLHVTAGSVIGVLVDGQGWYKFPWKPGKTIGVRDGKLTSRTRIPVLYGLARVTHLRVDSFYQQGKTTEPWHRRSPGWVQGEYVTGGVLYTVRGGPKYRLNPIPVCPWEVQMRDAKTGTLLGTEPLPEFGQESGVIPSRLEIEGAQNGLIGVATGSKGRYGYSIYQWTPTRTSLA